MTVDFPPSSPATAASVTTAPTNKAVDFQTLQAAFAAALRNYGIGTGSSAADTMLEILTPAAKTDNAGSEDRNQQHREPQQQPVDQNDVAAVDRKVQDKSEIRTGEINSGYQNRIDRHETLQNDYQHKIERSKQPPSPILSGDSNPVTQASPAMPPVDAFRPNTSVPVSGQAPSQNAPNAAGTNNQPLSVNVPNSAVNVGPAAVSLPGSVSAPASTPGAPPVIPPQALTIFTPLGRIGQTQKKSDEKDEDDEPAEGTKKERQKPFAVFEAIQTETVRSARQHLSRQLKEPAVPPELRQVAEKLREKPKEVEPEQIRGVKSLDELLNAPVQDVSVSKKGEPNQPNPTQYLHRIAAACEAAAQYAPIRMKINLDHLGTLTLRFFYKADKLMLRFETPSEESAQFLQTHLDGLRTLLSKRNVKIASVEIREITQTPTEPAA